PQPDGTNGRGPLDMGPPPFPPPAPVPTLREPSSPPAEASPPTRPIPFAISGDPAPWLPSDPRGPAAAPPGPSPAPPPPLERRQRNGTPEGIREPEGTGEPEGRPSEWGRAIFESEPAEGEANRFGRRG